MSVTAVNVPERSRFEVEQGGETAVLVYERGEGEVALVHTVVPASMEGQGVGSVLARTALAWAHDEGLRVDPVCSFVKSYLERHPDEA